MKKLWTLALIPALLFCLSACRRAPAPEPAPESAQESAQEAAQAPQETTPAPSQSTAQPPASEAPAPSQSAAQPPVSEAPAPTESSSAQPNLPTDQPTVTKEYTQDGKLIEYHTHPNGDRSEHHFSAGNVLEMTIDYFADGRHAEIRYAADGSSSEIVFDSAGVPERTVDLFANGSSVESLYLDGRLAESLHYDQNGNPDRYYEFTYHNNGSTTIEYDATTNLILSEHYFNLMGRETNVVFHNPDGILEVCYNSSGKKEYEIQRLPDGSRVERRYTSATIVEQEYNHLGQLVSMTELNPLHQKLYFCRYDPETGTLLAEDKFDNGKLVSSWSIDYPGADPATLDTYANGVRVRREFIWSALYGIASEVISCDGQGNFVQGVKTFTDGSYWFSFYTADSQGQYVNYMECYSSSGKLTETWSTNSREDYMGTWTKVNP